MPIELTGILPSLTTGAGAPGDTPERLTQVAAEFESLLIAQMLRSMREASGGGWLGSDDQSMSAMTEMAEQQFARVLASQGGLGLRDVIVEGLSKTNPSRIGE
jgi:Rod binding domain-containing protein